MFVVSTMWQKMLKCILNFCCTLQAKKESKEAEKAAKQLKGGSLEGHNDLVLALQRNQEKRGGMLSYLEEKYANLDEHDEEDEGVEKSRKRSKADKASSSTGKGPRRKRQRKVWLIGSTYL